MKILRTLLFRDLIIVAVSIALAITLVASGALTQILTVSQTVKWFGSFAAGVFFTSIFTTVPAVAAFGEIAQTGSLLATAFFGALGAVVGDLIIFRFFRDDLSRRLAELTSHTKGIERAKYLFQMKSLRWFTFFIGGLIIASPLPDELGVGLLGLTRPKTRLLILLSFVFNFLGIYAIGSVARSVV